MNKSRQSALELGLDELLGGNTPPDATFSILSAVVEARRRASGVDEEFEFAPDASQPASPWRQRSLGFLVGIAATLLVVALLDALYPNTKGDRPHLQIDVRHGSLVCQSEGELLRASAGHRIEIEPRLGDHWVAGPADQTEIDIAPLGVLRMSANCELELIDMEWKELGIGFGTGSLTVAVITGSVLWFGDGDKVTAASGAEIKLRATNEQSLLAARAREEHLSDKLASAKSEIERMQVEAARQRIDTPKPEQPAEPIATEPVAFEPLLESEEWQALFDGADWAALGADTEKLATIFKRLVALAEAGEEVPMELRAQLRQATGAMAIHAAPLASSDLAPGTKMSNRIYHPIMGSSWLASYLHHAELPLDKPQRRLIASMAQRYAAEEASRRAGYAEDATYLRRSVEELDLQERFYGDVYTILDGGQKQHVSPGKDKGRTGTSLVGPNSLNWNDLVQPRIYRDKEHCATDLSKLWTENLGLESDAAPTVRRLIDQYIVGYPEKFWRTKLNGLDRWSFYDKERTRTALRLQQQFFDDLQRSLRLTPAQLRKLQRTERFPLPFLK